MQLIAPKMSSAIAVAGADTALKETFHVESSDSTQRSSRLTEARENKLAWPLHASAILNLGWYHKI